MVKARTPPFCPYRRSAIDIAQIEAGSQVPISEHPVAVLNRHRGSSGGGAGDMCGAGLITFTLSGMVLPGPDIAG